MPKRPREGEAAAAHVPSSSHAPALPTPQKSAASAQQAEPAAQPPSAEGDGAATEAAGPASGASAAAAVAGAGGGALSVEGVCQWLVSINCGSAVEAFRRHDVDGTVLAALTDEIMKSELRIDSFGIRTKVVLERGNALAAAAAAASGEGEQGELTLQLEPVDEAASRSERQRKRPAEIDVFSAPSPRLPSTPSNPGSGSAGTTVSASPSPANGPSSAASAASSAGSGASRSSDVTTLTDGDMASARSERPDSAASTNVSSSPEASFCAAAAGAPASSMKSPGIPRSPAFIMSPRLQGSLAPEQLKLRDRVQEGDAVGALAVLAAAPSAAKKEWANTVDEQGFTLLMEAVALETLDDSAKTMRVLLEHGANAAVADEDGYTALHWAAACDNEVAVAVLVKEARVDINSRCSAKFGTETALHRGARMGNVDAVQGLLEHGADLSALSAGNQTADEIAGDYDGKLTAKDRMAIRKCLFTFDPRLRTLVLQHPDCLLHVTEDTHQEAPARIIAVLGKLRKEKQFPGYEVEISEDFEPATDESVGRAHTTEYIEFLHQLSAQVVAQPGSVRSVPFTPQVQKWSTLQSDEDIKDADKSDTTFSAGSLKAALRAAGSVIAAVDAVVDGTHRNAFCCVRPPGHHAGANGLESDAVSCGFCLFNNIAIGALHALKERSPTVQKVAVIDFDVHHGNGTQAILEGFDDPSSVFFFSIHLYLLRGICMHNNSHNLHLILGLNCIHIPRSRYDSDRDCPNCLPTELRPGNGSGGDSRGFGAAAGAVGGGAKRPAAPPDIDEFEFYPGTGADDIMEKNIVNAPIMPLWKYSSGGRESRAAPTGGGGRGGRSGAGEKEDGKSSGVGGRKETVPRGRVAFRHAVRQRLLPSLR